MSYSIFGGYPQVQITFGGLTWNNTMATGVTTIHAIDASFDGDEFLEFARGAFLRVQEARAAGRWDDVRPLVSPLVLQQLQKDKPAKVPAIRSIEYATIYDARRDASWDSVTVRIAAKTDARRNDDLVEDWTFQRPAVTGQQQLPHECPSCGAPLTLDDNGGCRYCRVPVAGARGGWKLVRAVPPAAPSRRGGSGLGRAWLVFWILFTIGMTVVLPIGIFAFVASTTDDAMNGFGFDRGSINGPSASSGTKENVGGAGGLGAGGLGADGAGALSGSATFSGGVTGSADGRVSTTGASIGSCRTKASGATGVSFMSSSTEGGAKSLSLSVDLPEGVSGPGTYELTSTAMTATASYGSAPTGGAARAQTWAVGPGTTVTFHLDPTAGGRVTVTGLQPSAPFPANDSLSQPLDMTVTFTCA